MTVIPRESQHFEFYSPGKRNKIVKNGRFSTKRDFKESRFKTSFCKGNDKNITGLKQSPLFTEDWLGLKTLDSTGKLVFIGVEGGHIEYNVSWYEGFSSFLK